MTDNPYGIDSSNVSWEIDRQIWFITVKLDTEEYHIAANLSAVQRSGNLYTLINEQIALAKSGQPYITWVKTDGQLFAINSTDLPRVE